MRENGKCLLCCDSYKEWLKLKELCKADYIVATSKYSFYKEMSDLGQEVLFFETNESRPYETVLKILDELNDLIDNSGEYEYARLFHFSNNLSDVFSYRIVRIIINLNLINNIVQEHHISETYLFDNKDNWVINESIYLCAKSRGIRCHIFDIEEKEPKLYLKTLKTIGIKTEDMISVDAFEDEKKKLHSIKAKSTKLILGDPIQEEIGILYCSPFPDKKHINWTIKQANAIGGKVKIICYYDNDNVRKFRDERFETDCLEDYFCLEDFMANYPKFEKERKKILHVIEKQLKVSHLDIDLSAYLIVKIRNYYYRELIDHFYMNICAKRYFSYHIFSYINTWGDTNFWETWICYDNTRDSNTKLFEMRLTALGLKKDKQPYQNMLSAVFAANKQAVTAFTEAYLGKICFIRDPIWGEKCSVNDTWESADNKKRVGFFPTGIVEGITTYYFYYNTLIPLIEKLIDRQFEVVFKYHPGLSDCWEQDVKKLFMNNEKFIFIDENEKIDDVIEQCNVIVTNLSNVILDAAVAQKAVFCIVEDSNYKTVSQHEKGFSVYKNIDDMIENIEIVLNDGNAYKKIVEKQNLYMLELTGNNVVENNGLIRSVLYSIS